jgi:hypothetical protein
VLGSATTTFLSSASTGAIPAAGAGAGAAAANGRADLYVDSLLRADPAAPAASTGNSGAANNDPAATRAEVGRLIAPTLQKGGDLSANDRTYLGKVVAARTGLSQADAEKRVSDVVTQAKTAADDARKAAAKLSMWLVASMLAGALAASLAAIEGGILRDNRWYEPGWKNRRV